MLAALNFREQRRKPRSAVVIDAKLRVPGATKFDLALLNLSTDGFRCETFYGLTPGERVYVTIPSFAPFEARVTWRRAFTYGCTFLVPLHEAVLATIVSRFAQREPMG